MKYAKPAIFAIASACSAVQGQVSKQISTTIDAKRQQNRLTVPAYEGDE